MSVVKMLHDAGKLELNNTFLLDTVYEGITGSIAYGCNNDMSDQDIYGICMLPLDMAFPHRKGFIKGFGPAPEYFETLNQHHIQHKDKEYDISILSIVKFFDLAAQNNPNIVDVLFLPQRCVLHESAIGKHIRANRRMFLHKGAMQKFLGYAHSQFKKMENKTPQGKRKELVEKYGVDTKMLYHVFRLCLQCEQILIDGDLNLERNSDILKSVRSGMYNINDAKNWFKQKELLLNKLYIDSKVPHSPNFTHLRELLLQCFEMRYGSMHNCNCDAQYYKEKLLAIKTLCN